MRNKFIISGIGIGDTGASKFLEKLIEDSQEYTVITPGPHRKLKTLLRNRKLLEFFAGAFTYTFGMMIFRLRSSIIRNSEVILLHPQSIGLRTTTRLIASNDVIKYYVLDNFLFCKQSYNYNRATQKECIKCIYDNADRDCVSFPVRYSDSEYQRFRRIVRSADNVRFFFQNENHKQLHSKIINHSNAAVIGLETSDFAALSLIAVEDREDYAIFHGDLTEAKGFNLLMLLVSGLPDIKFVVPAMDKRLERFENVTMIDMRWNSGLAQYVRSARLVLCLSCWSAPIEAALAKSIRTNGVVVVADVIHGFSAEFSDDALLKLSEDDLESSLCDFQDLFHSRDLQRRAIAQANKQLDLLNIEMVRQIL